MVKLKDKILKKQLDAIFENSKATLVGIPVLSVILLSLYSYYYDDLFYASLWFVLTIVVTLIRFFEIKRYFRKKVRSKKIKNVYLRKVLLLLSLTALSFSSFVTIIPLDNTFLLTFFLILLVGVSAAAVVAFSYMKRAAMLYVLVLFFLPIIEFSFSGELSFEILAGVTFLYLLITIQLIVKTNTQYLDAMILKERFKHKNRLLNIQNQKVEKLAYYDELTNLPKRILFFKEVENLIGQIKENGKYSFLLYLDIDNFKDINDFFGHNIGDRFLQEIAKKIEKVSLNCTISRISGDEFTILLPKLLDKRDEAISESLRLSKKILATVEELIILELNSIKATVSIGIFIIDKNVKNAYDVFKKADSAMYSVKNSGKNGVLIYDKKLEEEISRRYEIKSSLESAIENREFTLFLQPQYNKKGELIAGEALIRWSHPTKGLIFPDQFLSIAEEAGYSFKITKLVLESAFEMLESMENRVKIAINLTADDICNEQFYEFFKQMIDKHSHLKEFIELEITEQSLVNDIKSAVDIMKKINAEGICFSIDDFGTGYSSLSYLKDLPIDILKIDMSFVRNMFENRSNYVIVKTIIDMAKNLGLKTVAEGVETEKHFDELKKLGVDIFQGYYFSKPVSFEEFKKLPLLK